EAGAAHLSDRHRRRKIRRAARARRRARHPRRSASLLALVSKALPAREIIGRFNAVIARRHRRRSNPGPATCLFPLDCFASLAKTTYSARFQQQTTVASERPHPSGVLIGDFS